ncbi:MAG TPA: hypothetical protein VN840_00840 [Streptosporangiaceae bacterium]|nr:hypothetical protein [Streptosporangiaceae bacterium]
MIRNSRLRSGTRNPLSGRRLPLAAAALGVAAATVLGAGAAVAIGRHTHATPGSVSSISADIRHDEAYVARKNGHCAAFSAAHKCPFAAASTSNGKGGHLIAINLRQFTGDDCDRGVVYLFNGTKFLVTTRKLRPFSIGGVKAVRAAGTAEFAVVYWVSRSKNTSCAENGNAGTDTYKYRWNGTRMAWASGKPPRLPKVIVGSPADS